MRLRALAGAYAGQIRDYSTPVGLAALRSGTAEPVDAVPARSVATPPVPTPVSADSKPKAAKKK